MGAGDLIRDVTERPFARFAVAGACGFATDALLISLLVNGLGFDPHVTRFGTYACALAVTWAINRYWTFAHAQPMKRSFPIYIGVQLFGAVPNMAVYSGMLLLFPALREFPVVALVPAALAGLTVTYLGSKYLAFGRR